MAIFHVATSTPTKIELIEQWVPNQSWGAPATTALTPIGSFHFDDPEGQVGMQTHLIEADATLLQIPLTYRDAPLDDAADSLVGTLEHSVLGTRWVYDGIGDERFVSLLAGVCLTGQGHALGMAESDGRWYIAPSNVRLRGGGWTDDFVAVDRFATDSTGGERVDFVNDRFELTFHRRPVPGPQPVIGLTASTDAMTTPVVLASIRTTHG